MKDSNYIPDGSGIVMGDTKAMPNRGTSTGMNGDSYDADLSQDSTNRIVGISGSTKSDPWAEDAVDDPTFGPAKGDDDRDEGME